MRINKKGFTLVELLAVIVILAVVMLIAVTSVGPMMRKSRLSALGTEGIALMEAAETVYTSETMKTYNTQWTSTANVCFKLQDLKNAGYFEKGSEASYKGSVLVTYNSSTKSYEYKFWVTNGSYMIENGTKQNASDVENTTIFKDVTGTIANNFEQCPGAATGTKKASYSTTAGWTVS